MERPQLVHIWSGVGPFDEPMLLRRGVASMIQVPFVLEALHLRLREGAPRVRVNTDGASI